LLLQQHRFTYNEPMPVESCTQSLCDLALRFGEDGEEAGMVSQQQKQHQHQQRWQGGQAKFSIQAQQQQRWQGKAQDTSSSSVMGDGLHCKHGEQCGVDAAEGA
jgi:hypothetical protein